MQRRVELGAGIATAVLAVFLLGVLIFAPVVRVCTVPLSSNRTCPDSAIRTATLLQVRAPLGTWLYLLALLAFLFAGAAGAIAEARYERRQGALLLWIAAVLAFMGCSFIAPGIGLLYAPAVFALGLAGYASVLQRMNERRRLRGVAQPSAGGADPLPDHQGQRP